MPDSSGKPTVVVISQVYVPDPASVGQHMHDAAAELVRRGYRVVVFTSARGYEDGSVQYPKRETLDGVDVRRLGFSSVGKKSLSVRLIPAVLFLIQAVIRGLLVRNVACVFITTSPPFTGALGTLLARLKRAALFFWCMDLNPDQLIQAGVINPKHLHVRLFDAANRMMLRRSDGVIALDRFMAERINRKVDVNDRMDVLAPWPHEDHVEPVEHKDNDFRTEHDLEDKFVIMYSGNHGMTTPVTTVLEAALRLQHHKELVFLFVGGGLGKADVRRVIAEHKPTNIFDLPYQPFDRLRYSLSAADVHLVTMADPVVGCIHPCKVYGAMAVGRPVLFVGPNPSHVTDLLEAQEAKGQNVGWHTTQGDVDGCTQLIETILNTPRDELREMGKRARAYVDESYTQELLLGAFCDALERAIARRKPTGVAEPGPRQPAESAT